MLYVQVIKTALTVPNFYAVLRVLEHWSVADGSFAAHDRQISDTVTEEYDRKIP